MQLKMKTSLSGPFYSVVSGQVLDFDDDFPFSGDEVVRFTSAEYRYAAYIGTPEDLEAWLKADAEKRATNAEKPVADPENATAPTADTKPETAAAPTAEAKPAAEPEKAAPVADTKPAARKA